MNKLIIKTRYHVTVELLLMHFQMIERHHHVEVIEGGIAIDYPNEGLSQELGFWMSMAEGCGLVESYHLATEFTFKIDGTLREQLKREQPTKRALDHVEECLDMLHTGIMVGLHPQEAALGQWGVESQMHVVESVKEDFKRLSEAIKALRKET
jgi:hypothetical protein